MPFFQGREEKEDRESAHCGHGLAVGTSTLLFFILKGSTDSSSRAAKTPS